MLDPHLSGYHWPRARKRCAPAASRSGIMRLCGAASNASNAPRSRWKLGRGVGGVNYVYGTFLALRGLEAAGESDREAYILRAGEWLRSIQNADGGWGESCAGYAKNTFVPAPSAPSQDAWAILGLLASGDTISDVCSRLNIDGDPSARAAAGTKSYPPAPVFRVSFMCTIPTIATRSRCWLFPAT